jgi:hypothetical protein
MFFLQLWLHRSTTYDRSCSMRVDRHHRSYVSAVLGGPLGGPLGAIRCRTTHMLLPIHPRWILKYVIHIYYLFPFLYNSNCVK